MAFGLLKINNVDCSNNITTYNINAVDLHDEDSGRSTTNGYAYVNIVRKDQMEIVVKWELIDDTYKNTILQAIAAGKDIPIAFTYDGADFDRVISATYRGNRSLEFVGMGNKEGTKRLWNLSFSLIEQ